MYKIMKIGVMVGLGDKPSYIRMQENGSYGFCSEQDAQGVVVDNKPYHLNGMDTLEGIDTVTMEDVSSSSLANDYQAAAQVFAGQADAGNIDEATISKHPDLFPRLLGDGSLIKVGTHINWKGEVKYARNDLWDTVENDPGHAPNLWETIAYKQGYRIIPEIITAENPFSKGECGWWEDTLYRSIYDGANVWTPTAYPLGWELV